MRSDRSLVLCLLLVACSKDSAPNESKRMPKPPPPVVVTAVPADLRIEVTVDGRSQPPITTATLASRPPDFSDPEHRAWRISSLLEPAEMPRSPVIAATGAANMTIELRSSDEPGQPTATLFVTRRGEVIVALVDPADPFPDYHGQGRRLGRPGDPWPRIAGVTRIAVTGHQLEPEPPPEE
jgi:hypothetical protein